LKRREGGGGLIFANNSEPFHHSKCQTTLRLKDLLTVTVSAILTAAMRDYAAAVKEWRGGGLCREERRVMR